jgi:23S rRNA pseudouridine2605 synthase
MTIQAEPTTLCREDAIKGSGQVALARALSKLGYCSRSRAVELIRSSRVGVNGRIHRDAEKPVQLGGDRIAVDGREVTARAKIYLMLNKPRGVVTTAADEKGRTTVYAFLEDGLPWVAPVGRLDQASEGLLLLTNDSQWAARVTAPESHLEKTYHVQIACLADQELLRRIGHGVKTEDGERLRAKRASILRTGEKNTWLEIVLDEGKNRHIRRMLGALGIDVLRLVRIAIGPVVLGELPKGVSRPLTATEKRALDASIAGSRGSKSSRKSGEKNFRKGPIGFTS